MVRKTLTHDQSQVVSDLLGHRARLISGSKSTYRLHNPTNLALFNSNIIADGYGKIWYGDIDLTLDEGKLISLASALKTKIYVLYEMDGRFNNEDTPRTDKAIYFTDGVHHNLGNNYKNYIYRDPDGRMRLKG